MSTEIVRGIFQLVLPTPFAVGPVNCYLSTESPITLVDTGTNWPESRAELEQQLRRLGLDLSNIERIVITHAHADHFGLAASIVEQSGAEVLTHRYNQPTLQPTDAVRRERSQFYREFMTECGVPQSELEQVMQWRVEARGYSQPVSVDRWIDEGDRLLLGGRRWHVYHTPGHAGGLICLFEPEDRVLLSNDHLLRNISSNPVVEPHPDGGPRPHRLVEYLHHLERMVDLRPQIAWTGHGAEIHDVAKTVRQRLRFHVRRASYVMELLSQQSRTAYDLARSIFGRRDGFDSFLALSETIGHLDWLNLQGKVQLDPTEAVHLWKILDQ
ncbi:MAG: MBL fold metallo-hydrolase [Pirellulaceae bacterium]|nr:MBL fold metallo-hydrolase [Pirellulaceae bacterium]